MICFLAYSRSKSTSSRPYKTLQRSAEFYYSGLGEISAENGGN